MMPTDFKRIALNRVFDTALNALECGCTEEELEQEISEAFHRDHENREKDALNTALESQQAGRDKA